MERKLRKLKMDVPLQPLTDQRPWFIAGLLLAFVVLIFFLFAYLKHKGVF
jgi:hypothetical protein